MDYMENVNIWLIWLILQRKLQRRIWFRVLGRLISRIRRKEINFRREDIIDKQRHTDMLLIEYIVRL